MQDSVAQTVSDSSDHLDSLSSARVRVGPRRQAKRSPEIQVQKRDGRIEAIVVTCGCGEQVKLVCDYEETKPE